MLCVAYWPDRNLERLVRRWWKRYGGWLFLLVGAGALVWIVRDLGWSSVAGVLRRTAVWFPLIVALEALWISFDTLALRVLYGRERSSVPLRVWVRSALVAYPIMILLPAGRAGGEVARGSMLFAWVRGDAISKSTLLQAAVLIANSVVSLPCLAAVAWVVGWGHGLTLLLAGNALVTLVLGAGIALVFARTPLGRWIQRRFHVDPPPDVPAVAPDPAHPPHPLATFLRACATTSLGRVVQTIQYAVILAAVGGSLTPSSGLITQGIHLVGAGLGDFVPNAVGITEGVYRLFADTLGLGEAPERAVGIALVARLAQFALAMLALVIQPFVRGPSPA
jgi:hypothetical protein